MMLHRWDLPNLSIVRNLQHSDQPRSTYLTAALLQTKEMFHLTFGASFDLSTKKLNVGCFSLPSPLLLFCPLHSKQPLSHSLSLYFLSPPNMKEQFLLPKKHKCKWVIAFSCQRRRWAGIKGCWAVSLLVVDGFDVANVAFFFVHNGEQ